jgi:POT family proton-dependent oligopeptide transporter
MIGLTNYALRRLTLAHIGSPPDDEPVSPTRAFALFAASIGMVLVSVLVLQNETVARICVYAAGVVLLGIFARLIHGSRRDERAGLIAALVLVVQSIFFFIFYQQMSTSLNLFAQNNVNLDFRLFGWHLFTWIPEQYQNLNSIWIVVLSPVLVFIYNSLGRFGKDPSIAAKFAWGFGCVAIGYFIYGVGAKWAVNGQVSSWIMVWGYGLYSLGELLVSGLGLAMIARYVPARMGGFMMGAYFVATGVSQYLGSVVANIAHIPENLHDPLESLIIYTNLFNQLGWAGVACTVVAIAMVPLMKRLSAGGSEVAAGYQPVAAAGGE